MFRNFVVALVAASVFAAPVLAQDATPNPTQAPATRSAPATAPTVKADVTPVTHRKHLRLAHGTRMHKQVKYAHHVLHNTKYAHRMMHKVKYAHHLLRGTSPKAYAAVPAHHFATKSMIKSATRPDTH